jgi:hypothetical protein
VPADPCKMRRLTPGLRLKLRGKQPMLEGCVTCQPASSMCSRAGAPAGSCPPLPSPPLQPASMQATPLQAIAPPPVNLPVFVGRYGGLSGG